MKLACQENLLPGKTLYEKWAFAQQAGFDAIEIQAASKTEFEQRLPMLVEARNQGVVMSTICLAGGPFIGEFDDQKREIALERMAFLLEAAPQIGASGVVTPAAWGIFSKRLPPFTPPRDEAEDRGVLLEGLAKLGKVAAEAGSKLYFESLNRYEDHMVNTLAQACNYCEAVGLESVMVLGDLYHMNIEEVSIEKALEQSQKHLGHIHLSDSNRLEPGAGHIDFKSALATLERIGYSGYLALECRLSGDAARVLPLSVQFLRN